MVNVYVEFLITANLVTDAQLNKHCPLIFPGGPIWHLVSQIVQLELWVHLTRGRQGFHLSRSLIRRDGHFDQLAHIRSCVLHRLGELKDHVLIVVVPDSGRVGLWDANLVINRVVVVRARLAQGVSLREDIGRIEGVVDDTTI
jgi:hypothetical protein